MHQREKKKDNRSSLRADRGLKTCNGNTAGERETTLEDTEEGRSEYMCKRRKRESINVLR